MSEVVPLPREFRKPTIILGPNGWPSRVFINRVDRPEMSAPCAYVPSEVVGNQVRLTPVDAIGWTSDLDERVMELLGELVEEKHPDTFIPIVAIRILAVAQEAMDAEMQRRGGDRLV
jgi:hypothetical protein